MVVDRKDKKALALLYLGSGSLRNTANSSVLPTEFAAEPTVKMKPFSSSNFLLCTKKLSILSNFFFPFIDTFDIFSQDINFTSIELNRFAKQAKLLKNFFFKSDGRHAISRQENAGCPKAPRGFPRFPAKKR